MRVLLTGMAGSGKSTLVQDLRRRGYAAYDADDDGFSQPRADGRWGWRADVVASLLAPIPTEDLLFFAGCSEEQIEMPFDYRVVLMAPEDELVVRLMTPCPTRTEGCRRSGARCLRISRKSNRCSASLTWGSEHPTCGGRSRIGCSNAL